MSAMEATLIAPAEASVLAPSIGQSLLFSPDIEVRLEAEESLGLYTAERALEKRPGLKDAVIKLRAGGEGYLSIAGKLNCHHRTASAIATMFAENVDIERAKRVNRLRSAADKLVELIDNEPNSVPANVRALAASQLYDKAELLVGRATQRIERTERIDIYRDWEEVVEKTLEAGDVKEIEVDAAPGIGLSGGNVSAIEAADRPANQPLASDDRATRIDAESAVPDAASEVTHEVATTSDTDHAATDPPRRSEPGGGGGLDRRGGPVALIDSKEQNFSGNGPSRSRAGSI